MPENPALTSKRQARQKRPVTAVEWRKRIHRSRALDRKAKLVAYTLSMFMDERGHCFPSQAELARFSGYHRDTVAEAVDMLCARGYLKRRRQYRQLGWRYLYWATVPGDHVEVEPVRDPFDGGQDAFG